MIPLARPRIPEAAQAGIREVLDSGMLVEGARTRAFAEALAAYTGAPHAVLVNSGTSALWMALKALGIGEGDLVLVPAYTFPATANAVLLAGAEPVFADVDPGTWNLDAATAAARLAGLAPSRRRRVKAVMPVQAFGNPVDMRPLLALARRHRLKVVEDAACALGSTYHGRACGTHGDVGCYSFHPRKVLTTGEGGALVTRSNALARSLALLKNHGMTPRKGKPGRMAFLSPGMNLRFTEVAAVLGISQLETFAASLEERRALAERYGAGLRSLGGEVQRQVPGGRTNWQALVARLPLRSATARDRLLAALAARGVQATIGTYLVPAEPAFRALNGRARHPAAEALMRQAVALPFYQGLGPAGVDTVLEALRGCLG